jgi:hypothetical protein
VRATGTEEEDAFSFVAVADADAEGIVDVVATAVVLVSNPTGASSVGDKMTPSALMVRPASVSATS